MRTYLRTFTLALAAMLAAAPGPIAPQTSDPGAPEVGEILKLPQSVWTNINRFVFLVAFDKLGYEYPLTKLDSYAELHAASRQWGLETFPAMQKLAAELAKDDIGQRLAAMKTASDAIAVGSGDVAQHRMTFDTQSNALELQFAELRRLCEIATPQLDRLRNASKAAIAEYKLRKFPATQFIQVGADPDAVLSALEAADNRWRWLVSDVQELRLKVGKAQAKAEAPRLAELYARMGLATWKNTATAAQGFLADVPRQQKYLSGENYYDNCGPVEGRWYLLTNLGEESDKGGRLVLSLGFTTQNAIGGPQLRQSWELPDPSSPLRLAAKRPIDKLGAYDWWEQVWGFQKIGSGWWRVINRSVGVPIAMLAGPGDLVTVSPSRPDIVCGHPPCGNAQFWRFLPAGKSGGCRLVNSYGGDFVSLTGLGGQVAMKPTQQPGTPLAINQQWRVIDAK